MISSAYRLCAKMIEEEYPPDQWNTYVFHFSDGDNWSVDDTKECIRLLAESDHVSGDEAGLTPVRIDMDAAMLTALRSVGSSRS